MWRAWLISTVALAAAGCGDPCRTLSEKICRCEATAAARAACLTRVAARASQWQPDPDPSVERAGRERCAGLLDGCTCAALERGDAGACGLDRP